MTVPVFFLSFMLAYVLIHIACNYNSNVILLWIVE